MAKKIKTERKVESIMKPYELMLILSPELRETEVTKKLKELVDMIEKAGGKITNEDFWGKKQLAYRINKHNEGIYIVYNMELPTQFLAELKNHLRIEKDVVRSMIISLPANYTYVKYDIKSMAEEKPKRDRDSKKNISIKHNSTVIQPKKKEEVAEKKDEDKEDVVEKKVEKKSEEKESELDKKLDEILGGEDLKL